MSKTRSSYSAASRQQMVELVRSGRTPGDLAREFKPSVQASRTWVAEADRDVGKRSDGPRTEEREEIRWRRRENGRLREDGVGEADEYITTGLATERRSWERIPRVGRAAITT